MTLTQNALVLSTGELDAIETDTYKNRPEVLMCGSSMCRAKTSITKLIENTAFANDRKEYDSRFTSETSPLTGDDMPQFNNVERSTPLLSLGKKQYTMSKRTKTKIRQKMTAWSRIERKQAIKFTFITLTLTSKQIGTDKDYSKMLNAFFTYLRKYYRFDNYLYVNEIQTLTTNNIHSHIICDIWLPVLKLNAIWCRILHENGYTFNGKPIFESRNAKGNLMASPVDIKTIYDTKRVSSYVTKYVTKNESSFDCLIWNCSNSISRLFTSAKIWDSNTFSVLFEHLRTVLQAKMSNGEVLHIHLLSLYHSIQKKHFKINESVLNGTLDRAKYINKIKENAS
jgi:hypothetical protein